MRGDEKRKLESGQISKLLNSCRKQSPTQAVGKQKTNSKKYTTGQSRPQAKTLLKSLSIQIPASYSYAAQLDIHLDRVWMGLWNGPRGGTGHHCGQDCLTVHSVQKLNPLTSFGFWTLQMAHHLQAGHREFTDTGLLGTWGIPRITKDTELSKQ